MVSQPFEYIAPTTLVEAMTLLQERPGARLIAGGQDLLLRMKQRRIAPKVLIDLRELSSLRTLGRRSAQSDVHVGAMVTCMELRDDPVIQSAGRALAEAARSMGDVHVQNRATIGGHLATANPAADLAAAIVVLGASIHVASTYRVRVISAADFFTGPFDTSLEENEIITEITFPVPPPRTGGAYEKVKNPASGHPICGVAALVTLSPAGRIGICRVAVTGVTSHPARLRVVEATLEGAEPSAASVRAATSHATKDLTLISDRVASSAFRAHLTTVLTEQAIHRAISRAV